MLKYIPKIGDEYLLKAVDSASDDEVTE